MGWGGDGLFPQGSKKAPAAPDVTLRFSKGKGKEEGGEKRESATFVPFHDKAAAPPKPPQADFSIAHIILGQSPGTQPH